MQGKERLIVALDVPQKEQALELVGLLAPQVGMFKVGMELFYSLGGDMVRAIKERQGKVFLDLKMHDIPNTVASAVAVVARLGVDIVNVHAAGGLAMMQRAGDVARETALAAGFVPPKVIAVTVLTSINQEMFSQEIRLPGTIEEQVVHWALLAQKAGLDGVVASSWEIEAIRRHCGKDFLIITPGVRPAGSALGDQQRVMTPAQAVQKGASYVVIGRPILQADSPLDSAKKIVAELKNA